MTSLQLSGGQKGNLYKAYVQPPCTIHYGLGFFVPIWRADVTKMYQQQRIKYLGDLIM